MDILCCLFIWGFTFFGPLLTLIFGNLAVPDLLTLSGVFGVRGLCLSMSASIFAFSIVYLFASIFFVSFCPCILLTFSSTSLLASFSLYCFAVILALFLSSFGLSPQTILFISMSSSSGTFCLCVLILVFSFLPSLRAKCLLVFALVFISYLCFCPHVLCAIILELAKSK